MFHNEKFHSSPFTCSYHCISIAKGERHRVLVDVADGEMQQHRWCQACTLALAEDPTEDEEDEDELAEGEVELEEGESMEELRARMQAMKPKKPSFTADMLDTANSYDDKVALIRMLVAQESGRVALVLKNMVRN